MRVPVYLKANVEQRLGYQGRVLQVMSTGVAETIDLLVEMGSQQKPENFGAVDSRFRLECPGFTGAVLKSAIDCTVDLLISAYDFTVTVDGAAVTATIDPSQLPLRTREGAASAVNDNAAIAITSAGQVLLAANALRKSVRFSNIGTDPVAIGTTGLTWAKRVIVLNPGDIWIEEHCANVAWVAICDAAKTASVTNQEVLA